MTKCTERFYPVSAESNALVGILCVDTCQACSSIAKGSQAQGHALLKVSIVIPGACPFRSNCTALISGLTTTCCCLS